MNHVLELREFDQSRNRAITQIQFRAKSAVIKPRKVGEFQNRAKAGGAKSGGDIDHLSQLGSNWLIRLVLHEFQDGIFDILNLSTQFPVCQNQVNGQMKTVLANTVDSVLPDFH
ncbi:hypothetical protein B0H11DRAFT_1924215 [Mycena galericulata]|nr:hypothetical protein B0H11DRAFT_1924215 [Mycena galericulata]